MCLITSRSSLKKARKPVKVYKILVNGNRGPYFTDYVYKYGMNYAEGEPNIGYTIYDPYIAIYGGFLHAFLDEKQALTTLVRGSRVWGWTGRIVEMYIPAGKKYYSDGTEVASPVLEWREPETEE